MIRLPQLGAWLVIAALAWHAIRARARIRRLERVTDAWHVADRRQPHPPRGLFASTRIRSFAWRRWDRVVSARR